MGKDKKTSKTTKKETPSVKEKANTAEQKANSQRAKPLSKDLLKKEYHYFSMFLGKYSIFALAVGTILGQTSRDVVNKLVTGIISPAISLAMPAGGLLEWTIEFKESSFLIGEFLDSLIQMLVTMVVVYIAARYVFRNLEVIGVKKDEK